MSTDMLETLKSVDPAVLLDVVRQDQRSPTFEILEWTVDRLSDKGIINPDGLFRFSGQGDDEQGIRSWSVVLKIVTNPGMERDLSHLRYWKREMLAMKSGLLATLPGPVAAPRCYGTSEHQSSGWIWMEHIIEPENPHWTTNQYLFAARQLGRFNGGYVAGIPLPDYPWLCKGHVPTKLGALPPLDAWDNQFVSQSFSTQVRERVLRLWDERKRFYEAMERLPQTFSHFDFHRRNLIIRQQEDGQDQVVALDWAWCGYGALGGDLYSLLGGSALLFELEPETIPEMEPDAFEAYLAGLSDSGWAGNPELVHLGYNLWFALFLATGTPGMTVYATAEERTLLVTQQFGRAPEALASGWAILCEFALDRADQARKQMERLL
jgi:hypothetical protein